MWACKLLTWDARSAGGLGKRPGGGGVGGVEDEEGDRERETRRDSVASENDHVCLVERE